MVSLDPSEELTPGIDLILTCTVILDHNVNNSENVNIEWTGFHVVHERYVFTPAVRGSGKTYTSALTISPLAEVDSGTFTCIGTVTGGSGVEPAINSAKANITTEGKQKHCLHTLIQL